MTAWEMHVLALPLTLLVWLSLGHGMGGEEGRTVSVNLLIRTMPVERDVSACLRVIGIPVDYMMLF